MKVIQLLKPDKFVPWSGFVPFFVEIDSANR